MGFWIAAFVGDDAYENFETTKDTGKFFVPSTRTPVKRIRPGDEVLLYLAGEGFAARAEVASGAFTPSGETRWSSNKPPLFGVALRDVRIFPQPVTYKFPKNGVNPALGLHRYSFAGLSEDGFRDVLRRVEFDDAGMKGKQEAGLPRPVSRLVQKQEKLPETVTQPAVKPVGTRPLEKRLAGQYASREGRKRAALWTVAEMGASAFGLRSVEHFARGKAGEAERTWTAGGKAEQDVGAALDGICEHGYYLFHDVKLPDFGNVDHVALGPGGFFAIETKSHRGRVEARGRELLLNGRPPVKDFVAQAWSGCYRLKEILGSDVTPLLCFSEAFVEGRVFVRGVRALPLGWLKGEILRSEQSREAREVATAVNALGAATGCYPSAVPRASRKVT